MAENTVSFAKMNGAGNDIIVADLRERDDVFTPAAAIALNADPATKFDQIMAIHKPRSSNTDAYIHILNSDGSNAEACGNGTRCVVSWLQANGADKASYTFETVEGLLPSQPQGLGQVSVNMGVPRFDWESIPLAEEFQDTRYIELQIGPIDDPVLHSPSVASIGNPHAVFWVDGDVNDYAMERFGPMLENHPIFPERANISIAQVVARDKAIVRTWERGAGLTLACGSAACATLVCAVRTDRMDENATIQMPGGPLQIEWKDDRHIIMTGPTEFEFAGLLDPQNGTWERVENEQAHG